MSEKKSMSWLSNKALEEVAVATELQVDKRSSVIFGKRQGYDVCLRIVDNSYKSLLTFSVSHNNEFPAQDEFNRLLKEQNILADYNISQFGISFIIKPGLTKRKSIEKIVEAIIIVINFLQINNYKNCCESCGKKEDVSTYVLNGNEAIVCSECYTNIIGTFTEQENKKNENILAGVVGALLGSIVGVISIVIFGQLGYIASISGLLLAICTLKGYEFFGGKLSHVGILVSSIIMLVMTYVGLRLDYAISIMVYYEIDIFSAFKGVSEPIISMSSFIGNLILLYLFVSLGAVPTIRRAIHFEKNKNVIYQMGGK